ncbi:MULTISPECIES: lipoprotein insertase outer membrane protein LolB [unclassified Undibacterium]|uniref:lipoprotein insertase outer membrane protein LolB n=1 Tax=unclassified Undibacterium TaxID=2630295 RepID=UPI002AC8C8E8|nr:MULTISPECIES: lipoprotein insertase outer membrane protein LolB [unclassified Undibacterium]MEB0140338.1 lipoprotein insertase outer membrane protein LolB [Undibacterium sp. CCC2.1]MEB0172339.1 lipoprotein insertase outer membrane protein LolB [Undibacterium sp. CCC1.1]MEB0176255.1 lipoprotein insertase outer membrane protein LolB [Undibacterium sp. CCC3.4]MEB0215505.1 lipoprotein insertase outer membrane protein LolB [Undibacterium sp. 5I2]WPX44349.1 lipoprotein insertase outer membrane pr
MPLTIDRVSLPLTLAGALLTLLLSACSSLTPLATRDASASLGTSPARSYQEHIHLSGKMSLHYEQDNKPQFLPGNFDWEQEGSQLQLTLSSPLGSTVAKISADADGAMLERADQAPRRAANLDLLVAEALQWPLPVTGLRDWLQGFVRESGGGARVAVSTNANGQRYQVDGWTLRYLSWQDDGQLPKRLELQRDTATAGAVHLSIYLAPPTASAP